MHTDLSIWSFYYMPYTIFIRKSEAHRKIAKFTWSTASRILASCSRLALPRLRNSRLLRVVLFSFPVAGSYRVRILQVATTERPMASAVCYRLKLSTNGRIIACAARSSAAVLVFFSHSSDTSSCSAPLAFRAMMASTKDQGHIIAFSICNWKKIAFPQQITPFSDSLPVVSRPSVRSARAIPVFALANSVGY